MVLSQKTQLETERMLDALRRCDWVQSRAAEALGMKPANFSKLLKKYGLRKEVRRLRKQHREQQRA